ncbi:ABC transporter substrate-binding protein [Cohnella sp. 56]|uniref:ABC transporter substrate-binding protein n=1 Tax=Cohnella sp. 56 TaxID=3113722 RepID=UPI0030EA52F4
MKSERDRWQRTLSDLPLGSGGFGSHTMKSVKERIKMLERRARRRRRAAATAIVALLIAGAVVFRGDLTNLLTPKETAKPVISETETTTLNIMFWDNSTFMTMYGQPFIIRHPAVRFEYSAYPGAGTGVANSSVGIDRYREQLQQSHADLVQIPLAYVSELAADGLLKPLGAWMKRDKLTDESWNTAVRETLREAGGGELYGFAPEFAGYALYYNRDLFRENGVPEPTDGMTWEEAMNTAARFQGIKKEGKPVYGLSFGYSTNMGFEAMTIGDSQNLRLANAGLDQATANAKGWLDLWTKLADGHREGWINNVPDPEWEGGIDVNDLLKQDPFLNGRAAMTYAGNSYMQNLKDAPAATGFEADWAVVTQPRDKERDQAIGAFEIPYILAIPAKSASADAAWELLKYIMTPSQSERYIRLTRNSSLPTVAANDGAGDSRSAVFYRASVDPVQILDTAKRNSDPVYSSLAAAVRTEAYNRTKDLADGTLDVPALLKELQTKAEQALQAKPAGGGSASGEETP